MLRKLKQVILRHKLLTFLVFLNLTLNLIGINFGLPELWHPDEVTHGVTRMLMEKTLNPGRFIYPSFYYYTLFFVNLPYSIYLVLSGNISQVLSDPIAKAEAISTVFLTSRIFSAFFGSFIVILVYLVAKNLSNEKSAIIAAAFSSLCMAFVTYSHFATVDMPVTLLSLLAIYFILRMYDTPTTLNYILSGIFVGVAIGTKYYAVMLVFIIATAHLLINRRVILDKKIVASGMFCILTFLLTSPFIIQDIPAVQRDLFVLARNKETFDNMYEPFPAISYLFHLDNGMGTPLFLISLLGFIHSFFTIKKNRKIILLLVWVLIYYPAICITINFSFLRYMLPIVPGLIIFASIFLTSRLLTKKKRFGKFIVISLLVYSLFYAIKTDLQFINDSRYSSEKWINENIPEDKKVVIFIQKRYLPPMKKIGENKQYVNLSSFSSFEEIKSELDRLSPDYIIDTSLFYERYITYSSMYPKRSPLPLLLGVPDKRTAATEFYNNLLAEKMNYKIIKKFPGNKEDVPDPEIINPQILIFEKK